MSETLALILTLVLGIASVIIAIASLVFAVIYLIKISKLEKIEKDIIEICIAQCVLYPTAGEMIKGKTAINMIKKEYNIKNDIDAILKYYEGDNND